MKKILSILGTITLIGTSTTSLAACNTLQEYTKEQLYALKIENKIKTTNQEIRDNLEWIAPQEKPFNEVDNKYYYVVWRGDKNNNWRIAKFLNDTDNEKKIDNYANKYSLIFKPPRFRYYTLLIKEGIINTNNTLYADDGTYFKSVYRWNLTTQEPDLIVYDKGNVKVKGE
ncbi:lipoprotein [Spiroplasma endosymbiont of Phyllotreta cruciferae]|uniref:lipoprotein n=1 Tax=Spiroplasma endosymbiont of Phyllotreta cruciferae TaxID=2886375 RepID=UPI00209ED27B|nr:lipoprotein [Spiroplasma endosymbiont of Phyllotreta cruciferae]